MVKSVNRVTLIGNVVQKPDIRETNSGTQVCTFHMITDREWRNSEGNIEHKSEKHVCVAWDKLAQICTDLLEKGDKIFIEGRLETQEYQDGEGIRREQTKVIVSEMIKLLSAE